MALVPGQNPRNPQASTELLAPEFLPPADMAELDFGNASGGASLADYVSQTVLQTLPNDLTRMIYLASLRDCNSGMYLHPELSHQRGVDAADGALAGLS